MTGNRTGVHLRRRIMRRRAFASILLLLGLAACAKSSSPGGGVTSGIEGSVTVGPQCPVVHVASPCPDTPFGGKVRVSQSGKVIASVQVDADGAYRIPLQPGAYVVEPDLAGSGGLPSAMPKTVVVHPGAFTRANLTVDTGIR